MEGSVEQENFESWVRKRKSDEWW